MFLKSQQKNNHLRQFNITCVLTSLLWIIPISSIVAQSPEAQILEDDLATAQGLPWGGKNWAYSQIVEIQDGLVEAPVGRVVFDRHGIDKSDTSLLFQRPFSAIRPGKSVFITLWGSKIEGCFAEMIVQIAPNKSISPETIIPTMLEMGIDGNILQIKPQQDSSVKSYQYTYIQDKQELTATWYMVRQIFPIDSSVATILSNAKPQTIKSRVSFGNNSVIIPLGEETVKRWKDSYSFNPTCQGS